MGIPLVYLVSLFRKKEKQVPNQVQKIAIFAFAAIGDSILSASLFPVLKQKFPGAKITVFASKANAAIYPLLQGYDELIILPVTKPWLAIRLLRNHFFDLLIDTSQWSRIAALYSYLAKARFKIGFQTQGQYRHFPYDQVIEHSARCHELENFQKLLGPDSKNTPPIFDLEGIQSVSLDSLRMDITKPYIVLHPWASGAHYQMREWPKEYWIALAKWLLRQSIPIVITGSDQDLIRATDLAKQIDQGKIATMIFISAGRMSLTQTAKIILGAQAVVSVNTGIAHLADQLQIPTIFLNGPTDALRWGALGSQSHNLSVTKDQGGAFLNLGFEYPRKPTYLMSKISVQEVENALRDIAP